jgi:hypothetical protein
MHLKQGKYDFANAVLQFRNQMAKTYVKFYSNTTTLVQVVKHNTGLLFCLITALSQLSPKLSSIYPKAFSEVPSEVLYNHTFSVKFQVKFYITITFQLGCK